MPSIFLKKKLYPYKKGNGIRTKKNKNKFNLSGGNPTESTESNMDLINDRLLSETIEKIDSEGDIQSLTNRGEFEAYLQGIFTRGDKLDIEIIEKYFPNINGEKSWVSEWIYQKVIELRDELQQDLERLTLIAKTLYNEIQKQNKPKFESELKESGINDEYIDSISNEPLKISDKIEKMEEIIKKLEEILLSEIPVGSPKNLSAELLDKLHDINDKYDPMNKGKRKVKKKKEMPREKSKSPPKTDKTSKPGVPETVPSEIDKKENKKSQKEKKGKKGKKENCPSHCTTDVKFLTDQKNELLSQLRGVKETKKTLSTELDNIRKIQKKGEITLLEDQTRLWKHMLVVRNKEIDLNRIIHDNVKQAAQLKTRNERVFEKEIELNEDRSNLDEKMKILSSLESEIEDIQGRLQILNHEKDEKTGEKWELATKIQGLTVQKKKLEDEINVQGVTVGEQQDQLDELKQENIRVTEETEKMNKELEEKREERDNMLKAATLKLEQATAAKTEAEAAKARAVEALEDLVRKEKELIKKLEEAARTQEEAKAALDATATREKAATIREKAAETREGDAAKAAKAATEAQNVAATREAAAVGAIREAKEREIEAAKRAAAAMEAIREAEKREREAANRSAAADVAIRGAIRGSEEAQNAAATRAAAADEAIREAGAAKRKAEAATADAVEAQTGAKEERGLLEEKMKLADAAKREAEERERAAGEAKAESDAAKREADIATADAVAAQEESDAAKAESVKAKAEAVEAKAGSDTAKAEAEVAQIKAAEEVAAAEGTAQRLRSEYRSAGQAQQAAQQRIDELETNLISRLTQIESLESEIQNLAKVGLTQARSALQQTKTINDSAAAKIQKAQIELDVQKKEVEEVRKQFNIATEQLQEQSVEIELEKKEKIEAQAGEEAAKAGEEAAKAGEAKALNAQQTAGEQLRQLQHELNDIQEQREAAENLMAVAKDRQDVAERAEEAANVIIAEAEEAKQNLLSLEEKIVQKTEEIETLESKIKGLNKAAGTAQNNLTDLGNAISNSLGRLSLPHLEQSVAIDEELRAKIEKYNIDIETLQTKLSNFVIDEDVISKMDEIDQLKRDLETERILIRESVLDAQSITLKGFKVEQQKILEASAIATEEMESLRSEVLESEEKVKGREAVVQDAEIAQAAAVQANQELSAKLEEAALKAKAESDAAKVKADIATADAVAAQEESDAAKAESVKATADAVAAQANDAVDRGLLEEKMKLAEAAKREADIATADAEVAQIKAAEEVAAARSREEREREVAKRLRSEYRSAGKAQQAAEQRIDELEGDLGESEKFQRELFKPENLSFRDGINTIIFEIHSNMKTEQVLESYEKKYKELLDLGRDGGILKEMGDGTKLKECKEKGIKLVHNLIKKVNEDFLYKTEYIILMESNERIYIERENSQKELIETMKLESEYIRKMKIDEYRELIKRLDTKHKELGAQFPIEIYDDLSEKTNILDNTTNELNHLTDKLNDLTLSNLDLEKRQIDRNVKEKERENKLEKIKVYLSLFGSCETYPEITEYIKSLKNLEEESLNEHSEPDLGPDIEF
jgi:hypothetical protein